MSSSANDWKAYYETDFDMTELNIQMEKVLALCDFKNSDEEKNHGPVRSNIPGYLLLPQ